MTSSQQQMSTDDEMSMRQWNGRGSDKGSSSRRLSTGEWKIGVGDLRSCTRSDSENRRATADSDDADESQVAAVSRHWFDVFKNRCQALTSSCRTSVGEFLAFSSPEAGTNVSAASKTSSLTSSPKAPASDRTKAPVQRRIRSARAGSPSLSRSIHPGPKVVYFIRHGTAYCNVCRATHWAEDQRLTPRGWSQVATLRRHVHSLPPPDIVVTSTLSRAMETAVGVFGEPCSMLGHLTPESTLMAAQETVHNMQSASRGFLKIEGAPLIVAHEDCRERLGDGVLPNKRRTLSNAQRQFPGIDFSLVRHEKDVLFDRYNHREGETDIDISVRCMRFKTFLLNRPESRIAVVSHGHFLNALLQLYLTREEEFCNAEMRIYHLDGHGCKAAMPNLWFNPQTSFNMEI